MAQNSSLSSGRMKPNIVQLPQWTHCRHDAANSISRETVHKFPQNSSDERVLAPSERGGAGGAPSTLSNLSHTMTIQSVRGQTLDRRT